MSEYGRMYDGIVSGIEKAMIVAVIFVPLGIWKAVEIIRWVASHVHWQ